MPPPCGRRSLRDQTLLPLTISHEHPCLLRPVPRGVWYAAPLRGACSALRACANLWSLRLSALGCPVLASTASQANANRLRLCHP